MAVERTQRHPTSQCKGIHGEHPRVKGPIVLSKGTRLYLALIGSVLIVGTSLIFGSNGTVRFILSALLVSILGMLGAMWRRPWYEVLLLFKESGWAKWLWLFLVSLAFLGVLLLTLWVRDNRLELSQVIIAIVLVIVTVPILIGVGTYFLQFPPGEKLPPVGRIYYDEESKREEEQD